MFGNYFLFANGVPGYNPADLPLTILLNSKVGSSVTTQTGVSQWSGTNTVNSYIQTNTTAQPVYNTQNSLPSIDFDGINDNLASQASYSNGAFTRFFVVKLTAPSGFLFSNVYDYIWAGKESTFEVTRGSVTSGKNIASGWLNNNKIKVVMWRFDGTHAGHQVWVNGVQKTTTNSQNTANPGITLPFPSGSNLGSRGTNNFSTGSIFAFLERPIALSDEQAKAEFDYLIKEFAPLAILDANKNPVLDANQDFTY